jgi:prolyl 3-hydroxylase /prolyl 3,4-dihydroxylase
MSEFQRPKIKKKKSKDKDIDASKRKKRTKAMPNAMDSLDSAEYMQLMRSLHDNSQPYKHLVLDPLCDPATLAKVYEEVKHNMTATYKETDLFKLFQTGELGNITEEDELGAKMPELLKLRSKIYSKEFRDFVQNMTGCVDLTDRVDFSGNAYTCQCHLMCHDDVISTRCISFIIYLTDPEEPWTAADGGALELYPLDKSSITKTPVNSSSSTSPGALKPQTSLGSLSFDTLDKNKKEAASSDAVADNEQGVPATNPTLNILPKFNSMAFFVVQPGRSYHAVQVCSIPVCVSVCVSVCISLFLYV